MNYNEIYYQRKGFITFRRNADLRCRRKSEGRQLSIRFMDIDSHVSGVELTVTGCYDTCSKENGDFGTGWRLALVLIYGVEVDFACVTD